MQQIFGNAGFGFTFPYSLANTNNSSPIKFTGSGGFSASRNLYADTSKPVGVSGISFEPKQKTFHIDMPEELADELEKCKSNEQIMEVGIEWGIKQSKELIAAGVPCIHFYTMGKSEAVKRIVQASY
jgi:hypothetical protein